MSEPDIEIHYSKAMLTDPVSGKTCSSDLFRYCPHPAVLAKYGDDVQVSNFTCINCKYKTFSEELGFIECGYKGKRRLTNDDIKAVLSV